jgi:hypothetical protein
MWLLLCRNSLAHLSPVQITGQLADLVSRVRWNRTRMLLRLSTERKVQDSGRARQHAGRPKNVTELIIAKQRNGPTEQSIFASHHRACGSIISIVNRSFSSAICSGKFNSHSHSNKSSPPTSSSAELHFPFSFKNSPCSTFPPPVTLESLLRISNSSRSQDDK